MRYDDQEDPLIEFFALLIAIAIVSSILYFLTPLGNEHLENTKNVDVQELEPQAFVDISFKTPQESQYGRAIIELANNSVVVDNYYVTYHKTLNKNDDTSYVEITNLEHKYVNIKRTRADIYLNERDMKAVSNTFANTYDRTLTIQDN